MRTNTRRLLALIFGFGLVSVAHAQTYILVPVQPAKLPAGFGAIELGVRGLGNTSWVTGRTDGSYVFVSNSNRPRMGAGVFTDFHFSHHLGLQIGLDVLERGGYYNATFTLKDSRYRATPPTRTFTSSYDLRMRYLQMPLLLKVFTNEVLPRTRFYVQSGINIALCQESRITVNGRRQDPTDGRNYADEYDTLGDYGLLGGVGAEVRLTPLLSAYGGVGGYLGLADVLYNGPTIDTNFEGNSRSGIPRSDFNLYHRSLGFEVGIKLCPWRTRTAQRQLEPPTPNQPPLDPRIRTI